MVILTVDIDGTSIKYAYMDQEMNILSRGEVPTPQSGREELLDVLEQLYEGNPDTQGIAISVPGIIDSENGYIQMGGALHYNNDFYLRHALYARCPVPIHLENDAKCAAMAEAAAGSLKDVRDGFALIFGTMIGGAFIKDHQLYKGRHHSAGEVSYIIAIRNGYPDPDVVWGNRCGIPRLCRKYAMRKKMDPSEVNGKKLMEAYRNGDEIAAGCLDEFTQEAAVQIFNIQTMFDPELIAVGGGISASPEFVEMIRKHLVKLYSVCSYEIPRARVLPASSRMMPTSMVPSSVSSMKKTSDLCFVMHLVCLIGISE